MNIDNRAVITLKVVLLGVFAILTFFQLLTLLTGPGQDAPDGKPLGWPLLAAFVLLILCTQIVLVATWRLLGLVQSDRIFSRASFAWVDAIVWAIGGAWAVLAGLFGFILSQADDPGMPVVLFIVLLAVAALGLLMLVMRALLRRATTLRTDMEAVI